MTRRPSWGRAGVLVLLLTLATGCATPAIGSKDYRTKTSETAQGMTSAVNSARLGARTWLQGKSTSQYADTVVTHAEQDCGSISNVYDSRQPPDEQSIALKDRIDPAIQTSCSTITDLRIALRRGDRSEVRQALEDLKKPLATFSKIEERLS